MMKVVKMLLGAFLEAIGQIVGLLLFVIMAAEAIMLISAIILFVFLWDKAIRLKRVLKRVQTSEGTG